VTSTYVLRLTASSRIRFFASRSSAFSAAVVPGLI
jgi:hypothetical protein